MISVRPALDLAWQHFQRGQLQEAEQAYLRILQVDPNQVDALHLLGVIAGQTGRNDLAVDYLNAALRLEPGLAEVQNNLGNVFMNQRRLPEAVASYERALRVKPDYAVAHNNLGNALREQGRLAEAVASLEHALRLRPDYAEAHNNLGITLQAQGMLAEAVAELRCALRLGLKADRADFHMNLGNVLKDQGRLDDAVAAYRTAIQLKPDGADIHSNLIGLLHYHPGYDAGAIQEECRRWNQQHAEPLKQFIQPHNNLPDPERRLRIGYVSAGFCDHVVGHNIWPLLHNHDHGQFEITLYANQTGTDSMTEHFRKCADRWCDIVGWPDDRVAERIHQDGIDVLVDLALHTAGNRLLVFARKPAPVQVSFAGYPGSTGLSTIDYRLTDPYLDPPGLFDAFYSEQSIRLVDTFWCYDPLTDQLPVNALPALRNGFITFGCLNNFCKVNEGCLALWARVLEAVPQSRLLLLAPRGRARDDLLARLEHNGISPACVEFAGRQPRLEYLRLHQRIDVGFDPLPYNGHTTSLDAFWMGVPIVTLVGKTVVGRAGWSQLCNLGLQELAAETPEQYVALAARLAGDLPRLRELRATLRRRMLRSPLMDANRFARQVEEAYRQMWRRWCRQTTPAEVSETVSPDRPASGQGKDTARTSVPLALNRLAQFREGEPPGEPFSEAARTEPRAPRITQAHLDTALKHYQAGQLQEAEQLYLQILQVDPNQVDALHLLGVIAGQTGRNDLAVDYLTTALRLEPDFAAAHNNLGNVFVIQGKLPEAVASFQRAVSVKPDFAVAHNNLGNALREQGHLAAAVASLQQALLLRPEYPDAHLNLGLALEAQGKLGEAEANLQQAVRLKPGEAHNRLGGVLKDQGQIAAAIASYERALQLVPDSNRIHSNLLFTLHHRAAVTLSELAAAHAEFDRKYGTPLRSTWKPLGNRPDPKRRLRFGFVSPDLHRHPVGYFLVRCLENLDRQQADAVCYSNSADNDDLAARIRAAVTTWRDVFGWSDERLAEEIRADQIDILFDLAGHTAKNRLMVFARKPAPIQLTWAGYPGTTGLQAMDYILADQWEIPPEAEPYYCERVLRLPHAYVCYDPPDYAPPVSPLPALQNRYVTFASFNNPAKIGPDVVEVWARILRRLPEARLVLKYKGIGDPAVAGRLGEMFAGHGIDPGRVAFLGRSPHADLLAHYNSVDIGLDPFPYNGGLTTCEALWMGVPVIACPGQTFAGRHSLTHLSNVGLTQTIARDLDEYVTLAVSLAGDLPGLAAVRSGLRDRMASSPLCDGERFAGNLVQLLRGVWREWCRGQPADKEGLATC